MHEAFHETLDIVINALPVIFFLTAISTYVFGGGLADLINAMCIWAIG